MIVFNYTQKNANLPQGINYKTADSLKDNN